MPKQFTNKKLKEWTGGQVSMRIKQRKNYPASPSAAPGIMKIFESLLKKAIGKKRKFKALVLGATPELRNLVLKNKGELVTLDFSLEMILQSSLLIKSPDLEKEIIVKSDWLKSPLASGYFDLVLADAAFINVSPKDQIKLAKEIKRLLKRGGYFITRNCILDPKIKQLTVQEIDSSFCQGKSHWFDAFFNFLLHSKITPLCFQKTELNLDLYNQKVKSAYLKKIISKKLYNQLKKFQPSGTRNVLSKSNFEKILKKYFILLPVKQAGDFKFTQETTIFFFGKVKK